MPVPLTVVDSPYREITRPIIDFVQVAAPRVAPRRGHRLHPRVRGRPLVGAPAAQPERAAAQGPAAVRAGRDGDQRAVAAGLHRHARTWTGWTAAWPGPVARPARPAGTPRSSVPDAAARPATNAASRATCRPRRMTPDAIDGLDEGDRRRADRRARSPTAGTAWPGSDGRVVFVRHALPGERVRRRDHRGAPGLPARRRGRDPVEAVTGPGRAAVPVRRAGRLRRLRPPARRPGRPARAEGRRGARAARPAWAG